MTAAGGVYLAACLLLAAAGVAKVRQPGATQRALAGLLGSWTAVPRRAVQAGGVTEVAMAAAGLGTGAPGAAVAVAACYLGFAAFVAASLAGDRTAGCGCFGDTAGEVPLGPLHVAVNLALAAAAGAVAVAGGLGTATPERAVVSVSAAGLAWVVYLVLVPLPRLLAVVRGTGR